MLLPHWLLQPHLAPCGVSGEGYTQRVGYRVAPHGGLSTPLTRSSGAQSRIPDALHESPRGEKGTHPSAQRIIAAHKVGGMV